MVCFTPYLRGIVSILQKNEVGKDADRIEKCESAQLPVRKSRVCDLGSLTADLGEDLGLQRSLLMS